MDLPTLGSIKMQTAIIGLQLPKSIPTPTLIIFFLHPITGKVLNVLSPTVMEIKLKVI